MPDVAVVVAEERIDLREPPLVAELLGERFRGLQHLEQARVLAERHERVAQVAVQVERRFERVRGRRKVVEHVERALEIGDGLDAAELRGEPPGFAQIGERLVPRLALLRMAREHVELLRIAQRAEDAEMQLAPPLVKQRLVGDRLRERVLEFVGELLAVDALDEKARPFEAAQRLAQLVGRHVADALEQGRRSRPRRRRRASAARACRARAGDRSARPARPAPSAGSWSRRGARPIDSGPAVRRALPSRPCSERTPR